VSPRLGGNPAALRLQRLPHRRNPRRALRVDHRGGNPRVGHRQHDCGPARADSRHL